MVNALFGLLLVIFLASFAEVGILAVTNTLLTYQFLVTGQMVAPILLWMLVSAIAIFRDL